MEMDAKFCCQGNALQTSCFLIIPARILEDDDANLVRNLVLRPQCIINFAKMIWPVGDTWVRMLMVCIDFAIPKPKLLASRCEVGIGALGGLREIIEDERFIASKPPP